MWKYEKPKMEVVDFYEEKDVVTGSVFGDGDEENPWYGPESGIDL